MRTRTNPTQLRPSHSFEDTFNSTSKKVVGVQFNRRTNRPPWSSTEGFKELPPKKAISSYRKNNTGINLHSEVRVLHAEENSKSINKVENTCLESWRCKSSLMFDLFKREWYQMSSSNWLLILCLIYKYSGQFQGDSLDSFVLSHKINSRKFEALQ